MRVNCPFVRGQFIRAVTNLSPLSFNLVTHKLYAPIISTKKAAYNATEFYLFCDHSLSLLIPS